jgi:hypothetical protein
MIIEYYKGAFSRSWAAAFDWATGQGIALTWAMAISTFVCALAVTAVRARLRHHSWDDAVRGAKGAVRDLLLYCFGASLFLLFCLFAIFFVRDAPEQFASVQQLIERLRAQVKIQSAKGLFIECHTSALPATLPSSGRIHTVLIWGNGSPDQVITMVETFGQPNNPTAWPAHITPLNAAQCVVTKYSDNILININLRPRLNFAKMVRRSDGAMEGRGVDQTKDSKVYIPKMDTAADKSFVFYLVNQTPIFVSVEMPDTTEAQRLGVTGQASIPVAVAPKMLNLSPLSESAP